MAWWKRSTPDEPGPQDGEDFAPAKFARRASVATIGGFRPSDDPRTSWAGHVLLGEPDDEWPTNDGEPMLPVLQVSIDELPEVPAALNDLSLLTLFIGPRAVPIHTPNGDGWHLRAHARGTELAELQAPPSLGQNDPKTSKGSESTPNPLPIRWEPIDDYPDRDDVPFDMLDAWDALEKAGAVATAAEGVKVGGWPLCVQSEVNWAPGASVDFVLQIDTNSRIGIGVGFGAVFYIGRDREDPTVWHFTRQTM
jgi:hypothetical protein